MSQPMKRPATKSPTRAEKMAHERARMLAAQAVDAKIKVSEAGWLRKHLASCPSCASVAEEYRAIHLELRSLPKPEPPRDLWARTSAALDVVDAKRSRGGARAVGIGSRSLIYTRAAVGLAVVVAVGSLLIQSPIMNPAPASTSGNVPSRSDEPGSRAPLAVVNGTSYWITTQAGVYEIRGATAQCSATDGSCSVAGGGRVVGSIQSDSAVSAAISPDASQAAVWNDDKIAVVPLSANPETVPLDQLTPRPTIAATPTVPPETAAATEPAGASAVASPSAPAATPAPSASAESEPIAILSGYEIVGLDPTFSPDGIQLAFSARPADHSAGPDVYLWQEGLEQAMPVTRRHNDLFAGWRGQQILLSEITPAAAPGSATKPAYASYVLDPASGHAHVIDRPMLLPSADPTGRYLVYWAGTVELDSATGLWGPGKGELHFDTWSDLALSPASLEPAPPSESPSPGLPESPSPAPPEPTPSEMPAVAASMDAGSSEAAATQNPEPPALPQLLPVAAAPNAVHDWVVRWDAAGRHVAIWVADPNSAKVGRLTLLALDQATGFVDTDEPLLAADKVMASIELDGDRLVYTSAVDGKTYMQTVPALAPPTPSAPTTPEPSAS